MTDTITVTLQGSNIPRTRCTAEDRSTKTRFCSYPDNLPLGKELEVTLVQATALNDATLSALSLGTGVTLSPTFAPDTTSYTASVASDVEEVTVTLDKGYTGATVAYLDASDEELEDADDGKDDQQVELAEEGETVIKVQVTSEDGSMTRTYTVTVTRASELSVADAEAAEGQALNFTVTLSPAAAQDVTATWTASVETDDTAVAADFTDLPAATGTLTIDAGDTDATVTVATAQDSTDEEDETFTVTLSSPSSNAEILDATATGTIEDDDDPPTISIADDVRQSEDVNFVNLKVNLSQASEKPVWFKIRRVELAGDTATDADLLSPTNEGDAHLIAAGMTSVQRGNLYILNDTLDEPDETFTLEIHAFENATAGAKTQATITIEDDDAPPTLSVEDATATEGDAVAFTVKMAESGKQVTVAWATSAESGDSATAGTDFTADSGTLTFAPGTPGDTEQTIRVATAGDTTAEDAETFTLTLSSPANAGFEGDATEVTAKGTIEDSMLPVLSVEPASATEGSAVSFKVKLSVAGTEQVTVDWQADAESGDTAVAGTDFTAVAATALTFTAGTTEQTVTVSTTLDMTDEEDETFTVRLSNQSSTATLAADPTAQGTITDDDDEPTLSVEPASAFEGDPVEFTVTLDPASGRRVMVGWDVYAESGDSATAGTDFTEVDTRTLAFTAGETAKTLTVATAEDDRDEEDETFTLTLSTPENAGFAGDVLNVTAQGTITDDDDEPALSVNDPSAIEGSPLVFEVTLMPESGKQVTVDWAASAETGDSATAGTDFTAANGALTFTAGVTTATFTVATIDDDSEEDDETVTVTLSNGSNATLPDPATATGTITDDDGTLPTLSIADAAGTEGGNVTVTATLSAEAAEDVTATWTASIESGDTAADADLGTTKTGEVTVTAGLLSGTFDVPTAADTDNEADEMFTVTLSGVSTNAQLAADPTATGTIENDDAPAAPTDFRAEVGNAQVELSWDAPAPGANITRHEVRRKEGSGSYPAAFTPIPTSAPGGANGEGLHGDGADERGRVHLRAAGGERLGREHRRRGGPGDADARHLRPGRSRSRTGLWL